MKKYFVKQSIFISLILIFNCIIIFGNNIQNTEYYDSIMLDSQSSLDNADYVQALNKLNRITPNELAQVDDTTLLFYNTLKGKILFGLEDYTSSILYLKNAISFFEKLRYKYPSYIQLLFSLGCAYDIIGERDEAESYYRKVLLKGKVVEHDSFLDNNCLINLGNIYNERGDYKLAKEMYDKIQFLDSLQIYEIHGDYYGRQLERYMEAEKQGDWKKAKEINDSLIDYTLIKYGPSDPFYLSCLGNRTTVFISLGKQEEAKESCRDIIQLSNEYKLNDYEIGNAYLKLIELLSYEDKLDEASNLFTECASYINQLNDERLNIYESFLHLGTSAVRLGLYNEGIQALELFLNNIPDYMEWGIPYAINKLSWSYLMTSRHEAAIELLSPLLSNGNFPPNYKNIVPYLYKTITLAYYYVGDREKAFYYCNILNKETPEIIHNDEELINILTNASTYN